MKRDPLNPPLREMSPLLDAEHWDELIAEMLAVANGETAPSLPNEARIALAEDMHFALVSGRCTDSVARNLRVTLKKFGHLET